MYDRVRISALTLGAALVVCANASATTITTTCYNSGSCANGLWKSSQFITGAPTELDFTVIKNLNYPSGINLPANGNSSIVFGVTGPAMVGNATTGQLFANSLSITSPAGGENAMVLYVTGTGTITVKVSDGTSIVSPGGWFGFSASHPLTTLTVTTTSGQVALQDFLFATSSLPQDQQGGSTPEVATFFLTCGGLLILFGSGRRLVYKPAA